MKNEIDNTIYLLEDLFKQCIFEVPQYQRAYAWTDEQLSAFVNDLKQQAQAQLDNPDKSYFLGTLLLHELNDKKIHVVDGQQRLTTTVIFIAAAIDRAKSNDLFKDVSISAAELIDTFLFTKSEGIQKFHTIHEDDPFFRSYILKQTNTDIPPSSSSSKKIKEAFDYFVDNINDDEWFGLVKSLLSAKVMVYSVQSSADATLIFELQNDRGKKLTALEAIKSYLMHLIYLNSSQPEYSLQEIQKHFADIFRDVENQSVNNKMPNEDSILSYFCVAYLDWNKDEWRDPKKHIKDSIKQISNNEINSWVLKFVADLKLTYSVFTELFNNLDKYNALAELIILDRMATFWPLILKAYLSKSDSSKEHFKLMCRLIEVFAMRCYGIGNMRSDTGLPYVYTLAKKFDGNFEKLNNQLFDMSNFYDLQSRCESSIDNPYLYKTDRKDTQYLLWRYENHLRSEQGRRVEILSWKQYLSPSDEARRLSIEHIAAEDNKISETMVRWDDGAKKRFKEVATHRLGNLVIDSKSSNSSKGKGDFSDKLEKLTTHSTYLSQGELKTWAKIKGNKLIWTVESVKERHQHLRNWALDYWSPKKYYTRTADSEVIEAENLEYDIDNTENNYV